MDFFFIQCGINSHFHWPCIMNQQLFFFVFYFSWNLKKKWVFVMCTCWIGEGFSTNFLWCINIRFNHYCLELDEGNWRSMLIGFLCVLWTALNFIVRSPLNPAKTLQSNSSIGKYPRANCNKLFFHPLFAVIPLGIKVKFFVSQCSHI